MLRQLLELIAGPTWHTGLVACVGLCVAGFVLLVGRLVARRPSSLPKAHSVEESGDPFTAGPIGEMRSSARRSGGSVAVLVADAATGDQPAQGTVSDRSLGGLGLLMPQAFALGA